jgi:hypothetical protein
MALQGCKAKPSHEKANSAVSHRTATGCLRRRRPRTVMTATKES